VDRIQGPFGAGLQWAGEERCLVRVAVVAGATWLGMIAMKYGNGSK
jgi:hypothetical protein